MTGNWTPPVLTLEVALETKWWEDPTGSWTDISSRLRAVTSDRGRQKTTDVFRPGTLVCELDNSDRLLDPEYASALNYRAGGKGLPYCPVRLTSSFGGNDEVQFYGFLDVDCWEQRPAAYGKEATVTLVAVDRAGLYAQVPSGASLGLWEVIVNYLDPDLWFTGDAGFPALGDTDVTAGSVIPNMTTADVDARIDATGASDEIVWVGPAPGVVPSGIQSGQAPVMRLGEDVIVTVDNADAMPSGDEDDITVSLFWYSTPAAVGQGIVRQKTSGGTDRWKVACDSAGDLVLTVYDSGGSVLDSVTATGPFDDQQTHHIIVRHEGGVESLMKVDGTDYTTTTPIAEVKDSDLVLGGSSQATWILQVLFWRRAVSDAELSVPVIYVGTGIGPWRGDTLSQRVGHWFDAFNVSDSATVHGGSSDASLAADGMFEISGQTGNLSNALTDTASSWGGQMWAQKDGTLRVRSATALSNATYATHYATPCANLTDEASPAGSPTPLRRGNPTFAGARIAEIENHVTVSFAFGGEADDFDSPTTVTLTRTDGDSIDAYGERRSQISTDVGNWEWAATIGDARLSALAEPAAAIDVELYPWGDDDICAWLFEECELERMVTVTWTPPNGGSATDVDLNIQGYRWSWGNGTDMSLSLSLAPSF